MFNHKEKYNFINLIIEQRDIYTVKHLQHAIRVNNAIDIYRQGRGVFDLKKRVYINFESNKELENYFYDSIKKEKQRLIQVEENDKLKVEHKITDNKSLKALREKLAQAKVEAANNLPEYYHFKNNAEIVSKDNMYFLFHNGFVKIGRSKDVAKRLNQLKTSLSCAYSVYVFEGKGDLERKYHHIFSEYKQTREWFYADNRIKEFIKRMYNENNCILFFTNNN